jgi:chromosome segregation ATPase
VADAEKRCAEAQSAHAEAEARSVSLEAEVARLSSALASERKHTKMSMETAAKAHLRKEEAFAAETRALGAKLHAAEARVAASDGEAKRLATELESIRGDETRRAEEALAAAEEKAAAAEADAEDAREKADLTEKESLFFLGEMQTAVAEAEKKIIALHKTVASRDVKLAAADAEVRALKNAVRAHEAKLADGEKLYRSRLAAALEERGAKHAEELESARGEVEGNAVMLEMENEQLLKNLDEKRVKIRALQAEHARATEKMRRLRDEAETAKAAEAEAERRRAEAERARDELADRLATEAADATKTTTTPGGSVGHKARFEALARAMWNRGTRPGDLDGDAASALESFGAALEAAATRARGPPTASTPKSKILEMTQAAQKVSFSRIRASVEAKKADIKRRSSLGLDNASTELASLRRTIATMMEGSSSAKKDKTDTPGPSETPETAARGAPRPKRASMMARMTFGDSPSPAPASERRSARATAASARTAGSPPGLGQENAAPDATRAASKPTRLSEPEKRSRRSSAMAQRRQALRNLQSQVQAAAR